MGDGGEAEAVVAGDGGDVVGCDVDADVVSRRPGTGCRPAMVQIKTGAALPPRSCMDQCVAAQYR